MNAPKPPTRIEIIPFLHGKLTAEGKLSEVFLHGAQYYDAHGEQGLRQVLERQLTAAQAYVQHVMSRNVVGATP